MLLEISATIAVVSFVLAKIVMYMANNPFPQIHTKYETVAGFLAIIFIVSMLTAVISAIWKFL